MPKIKLLATVCIAMLALTAIALASSASAQWMVKGTTLSGTQTKALATTAAVDETSLLKAAGVTITCKGATLNSSSPQIEASGEKGSAQSLTFTECSVNEKCAMTKTIGTVPIVADTPTLDGTQAILYTLLPKTKTIFTTIKFEGAECALLGTQPVTGRIKIKGPTGQVENTLQEIQAEATEASGELKEGSSAAELKGAALLRLSTGEPWSFLEGGEEKAGEEKASLTPIKWSGGGECPLKEGQVYFAVVGKWCEYEVKNNNAVEKIKLKGAEVNIKNKECEEKGCVAFVNGVEAGKTQCQVELKLNAGEGCRQRLEYKFKPAGQILIGYDEALESEPSGKKFFLEKYQIVE